VESEEVNDEMVIISSYKYLNETAAGAASNKHRISLNVHPGQ
jgi:hypothetical protein